ncbi:MAG: aspartate--tRNA ligase [SAR86 cluster bacterium]|uniref:Aspartate--tRNA(Asp/Asn) ligase n=1 Tax=SAR86 cluster bacterium TaxID=2030880 RepID=A0A520MWT6_9GAMM|nr:MAG: aspartate--tRNA ligase [SAR86 cluster bacterium]
MKSHYCGEITSSNLKEEVTICGWIHRRRDHGGVIFLDVRDIKGICQVVVNPDNEESFKLAESIRNEFVVQISGLVRKRLEGTVNENMHTGEIEIEVKNITILSKADTPVFPIDEYQEVNEDVRLKNRVLDLRRPEMKERIITRSKISSLIRNYLDKNNFHEIETPILTKATPEGARDYILPSRVQPGSFYALPQSPQLFKQLLMMGGFDKYYQIARCFRDEDLRADRQPEFTQIDIEASFVDQDEIMKVSEKMIKNIIKEFCDDSLEKFEVIDWHDAIDRYGCDKPDLRIPLQLVEIADLVVDEEFKVFSEPAKKEGSRVVALKVPNGNSLTRGQIDDYTKFVSKLGAKGLAYIKINDVKDLENGIQSPILKFLNNETISKIIETLEVNTDDIIFFGAGTEATVNLSMSSLIKKIGEDLNLYISKWAPCWVVNFPMFEINKEGSLTPLHHPFTLPKCSKKDILDNPDKAIAHAYDVVLNGYEIGGGSLRIYDKSMQETIFSILNISKEEADNKFGFLLKALSTGCPPHGGIAFGLDRIVMLVTDTTNIRDVIAFPKTQSAACLLTDAPSKVEKEQLDELKITSTHKEE